MQVVQQIIITDTIKLTLLPTTYTFEIEGNHFEADWDEPYTTDERDLMIEAALEQIAIEAVNFLDEDEHEGAFLTALHKVHNQLLPDSPIE